jgi:hypothetical protein
MTKPQFLALATAGIIFGIILIFARVKYENLEEKYEFLTEVTDFQSELIEEYDSALFAETEEEHLYHLEKVDSLWRLEE